MSDPFEALGEAQISSPVKARQRAAAKRAQRKLDKKLDDKGRLFALWQSWHEEQKAKLLDGPMARQGRALVSFLERMTLEDGEELLTHAEAWLGTDDDTKYQVLRIINNRIMYLREAEGWPPIDDALPDEPDTVFQKFRALIIG